MRKSGRWVPHQVKKNTVSVTLTWNIDEGGCEYEYSSPGGTGNGDGDGSTVEEVRAFFSEIIDEVLSEFESDED